MRERKQLEFEDSGHDNSALNKYRVKQKFHCFIVNCGLNSTIFHCFFFRTRVEELVTPFAQVRVFFPYSRNNANSNG